MSVPGLDFNKDPHSDCGVCRFWASDQDKTMGRCLRHAPSPVAFDEAGSLMASWPRTHQRDVCGEFAVEVEP